MEIFEYLAWIGFVVCAYYVLKVIFAIAYAICHKRVNVEQFSQGWVAITGATDGIGLAFAEEFARRGFKVLLISRN